MNKKLLILSVCLWASFYASAHDLEVDGIYYNITSSTAPYTVEVTYYGIYTSPSYTGTISIPNTVIYNNITYSITSIGYRAFFYCSNLTAVAIPNSVNAIGNEAFGYCSSLTSIIIPNSVTNIGSFVFNGCSSLLSIDVDNANTVYTSENGILFNKSKKTLIQYPTGKTDTNYIIPNTITVIEYAAFRNCSNLISITIPELVDTIRAYNFEDCLNLTTVNFNATNCRSMGSCDYPPYNDPLFSSCTTLTTVNIGNNVQRIPSYAFTCCDSLTIVTIPNSVTWIGNDAFSGCTGLTSIAIPNSVTFIGEHAFSNCFGLTSITIPESVDTIGLVAFQNCYNLTTVNFNAISCNYRVSPYSIFNACTSIETINIGNNVQKIPNSAFIGCDSLTIVTIPNSVKWIGSYAFHVCRGLTSVTIPNSVTFIGVEAFSYCSSLTIVTIPDSVTNIEYRAFADCYNLQTVCYNAINCTTMGGVFSGDTAFRILNIGDRVKNIPELAFSNCNKITSVIIPNNIISIGDYAFSNCSSLTFITTQATTPPILGDYAFKNVPVNIPVIIPCLTYDSYTNANRWNSFSNFIVNGTVDTSFHYAVKCYNIPYTDDNFTTPIDSAGIYYTRLANSADCDSVICLTLTENPYIPTTNYSADICQGGSYSDANFTNLTQAGYYYDTLQNNNGCDSVVCLYLSITTAPISYYTATFCQGGSYSDANFTNLTQAGTYYDTLQNANGCDSIVCLSLTYAISPAQQLCMVSVDENYHNEIIWKKQDAVVSYNLYREGNTGGQYDLMANVPYTEYNSWIDSTSNASIRSYRYKVSGVDTCGNESALSDPHKTMHLTISTGQNNSWNLIWTPYEGMQYSTYNIYRSSGDTLGTLELIGTMPAGNTSYTDFSAPAGYVYYVVEIMLDEPCVLTKSLSSIKSNIASNKSTVGIKEIETESINIYPNPTTGQLTIDNGQGIIEDITIYDISGRTVETWHAASLQTIDISHLSSGIYLIKVKTKEGETVRKIVKQ